MAVLSYNVWRYEAVVLEDAAIPNQLSNDPTDVPCVVQATVLATLELQAQALKHLGQVPTRHSVERGEQFPHVYPLIRKLRESHFHQDTLGEQTAFDVPRAVEKRIKFLSY